MCEERPADRAAGRAPQRPAAREPSAPREAADELRSPRPAPIVRGEPRILAVLDTMKARGEILDATLRGLAHEAATTPDRVGNGILAWESAVTREAHDRGVLVDAGTDDMGSPEDTVPNLHREMAFLVDHAGFTLIEANEPATGVAAMTIGQEAERGTVTPGERADLVVLGADPPADIRNTRRIVEVFRGGERHER